MYCLNLAYQSTDSWMNLQLRWDLYHAREAEADILKKILSYKSTKCDKVGG